MAVRTKNWWEENCSLDVMYEKKIWRKEEKWWKKYEQQKQKPVCPLYIMQRTFLTLASISQSCKQHTPHCNLFPKHGIWNIYHSAVELQMAVRLPACVFELNSGSVQEQQLFLGTSHCSILTYEVFLFLIILNYNIIL